MEKAENLQKNAPKISDKNVFDEIIDSVIKVMIEKKEIKEITEILFDD